MDGWMDKRVGDVLLLETEVQPAPQTCNVARLGTPAEYHPHRPRREVPLGDHTPTFPLFTIHSPSG
eukprot:364835-Chlamydomonas_euryale.AAC.5